MMSKLVKRGRLRGYLKLLYVMLILTGVIFFISLYQNLSNYLRCPVVLDPAPSFTWRKSATESDHNDSVKITLHNGHSLEPPHGQEKSCQPHKHVFFLKTHKTASSTIMNILFRFGESHHLNIALPAYNYSQFFYPHYFNAHFVDGFIRTRHPRYDILCHHMRFMLTEVEKVMPHDTFYFTILRNPISLMESSFSYYKGIEVFNKAHSLDEFLRNPNRYYNISSIYNIFARNLMTFDLGFNPDDLEMPKHIQLTQKAVEAVYNLVLITEYFDESLVLLKDALCWTFDDVISFPLNSRSNTSRKDLSFETQEMIKTWNQLDWQLYIYFNSSFWKQIDAFGRDRMQYEVQELQRRRAKLSDICIEGQVDPNKITDESLQPFQSGFSRILGYNLKPGLGKTERLLCQRFVMPELQYTQLLLRKNPAEVTLKENVKSTRRKHHISGKRRKQSVN